MQQDETTKNTRPTPRRRGASTSHGTHAHGATQGSRKASPSPRRAAPAARRAAPAAQRGQRPPRQASAHGATRQAPSRAAAASSHAASAHHAPQSKKRYILAIDGLRAFAVIAVMLYHLNAPFAQGGLLGVTVFFVISGYLITGLLTAEWEASGTINLPQFWMRRIRRLFPAIVTVIVVMVAVYALLSPVLLTKMRPDIVPGLFWFENWWYILRDISYFDALGAPSPLTHFWSLAIEEQFYLVWPILLLGAFKLDVGKTGTRRGCLVLALVSVVAMALMYNPQEDPSRVYYGTDTRAFSLLIGAWLSFAWPGSQLTEEGTRNVPDASVRILDIAGIVSFVGIVVMCVAVSGFADFMYYGGLLLCSVLAAVVIAALSHPKSQFARVAEAAPLVWVGQRSYGMYLWHFPVILLFAQLFNVHGAYPWWFDLIVFAVVFALSAASYKFIETPIRRGAIGDWVRGVRAGEIVPTAFFSKRIPQVVGILAVTGVAVVGCIAVPDEYLVPQDAIQSTGESASEAMDVATEERTFEGYSPLLIGDSVPGDTQPEFESAFPHGLNDSYIGRFPFQAAEVLKGYVDQNAAGEVVVVASFSNSTVRDGDLDNMLAAVGSDRQLYLVNCYVTEGFMEEQNAALQAFADQHENVHIIDWASLASAHAENWIYPDGTHLVPGAYQMYIGCIMDAISADLAPEEKGVIASSFAVPDDYHGEVASVNQAHAAEQSSASQPAASQSSAEGEATQPAEGEATQQTEGEAA